MKNNLKFLLILFLFSVFLNSCSSVIRFGYKSSNEPTPQGKFRGWASYYADDFHGKKTANGEIFDMNQLSAAHRSLPFGTKLKVVNLKNRKSIIVRINDRGPFNYDRMIDLSKKAAEMLGFINQGIAEVECEIVE